MALEVSKGTLGHQSKEVLKRKGSVATSCEADEPKQGLSNDHRLGQQMVRGLREPHGTIAIQFKINREKKKVDGDHIIIVFLSCFFIMCMFTGNGSVWK